MDQFYLEHSGIKPSFDFIYVNGMCTLSISYYDAHLTRSADWWDFIDKIKRSVPAAINCGSSDDISGNVSICCIGRYVSFKVDRGHYAGTVGRSIFNIPKEMCMDALIEAATVLEKWEKKQAVETASDC
jgi:hypothetical protein